MATKEINALAKRGLEIKKESEKLSNELAGINAKLVEAGAQTIELDMGRVTITAQTGARASGKFELIFDKEAFLALPKDNYAREAAMATGIVRLEQGMISGRNPVVQYSLRS